MQNPLYNQYGPTQGQNNQFADPGNMVQKFEQFKRAFSGNPEAMVQQLMQSGRMNQAQFEQFKQIYQSYRNMYRK